MHESDILIIGGGISGLTASWQLQRAGKKVALLEARDRFGGRIYTADDGSDADLGPSWFWVGQPLIEILQTAGFDSENGIFVTNTTFRRPPENRNPTKKEMAFFRPYLMEIIRLVDPKVIVLTGKFSMLQLIGEKQGISKVRGNWYEVDGRSVIPVFHPAYLLYNSSKEEGKPKWLMSQDMQAVRAKYDKLGGRQDLLAEEQS